MSKEGYLNIPISCCVHTVKNNLYAQFQLYCFLKANTSNGFFIKDKLLTDKYCKTAKIAKRTFQLHFKWLVDNKWIYQVSKPKAYIVVSFPNLLKKKFHTSQERVLFTNRLISKTLKVM